MQGTKAEAPKAVESAKSDAKSGNGDALKGLKEALDAAKDADIKAEAAKAFEPKVEEAPKPEKLYIPETDAKGASYNDTNANLLDGNGSNAFKTAHFTSSGGGSESNAGRQAAQSDNKGATKAASGTGTSVTSSTTTAAGSGVKSAATASEAMSSGKVKTTKSDGDKGGETGNNQGDGLKTETGKKISSDDNSSKSKGETANFSNNNGETRSMTGQPTATVTSMANVEDTIVTGASENPSSETLLSGKKTFFGNDRSSNFNEAAAQKKREEDEWRIREEKRNGLRQQLFAEIDKCFRKGSRL